MGLKILIILLFVAMVISLTSGLWFILRDVASPRKRGLYALGIRVCLATLLLATIFYGLYTGQLGSAAPWDRQLTREQLQQLRQ